MNRRQSKTSPRSTRRRTGGKPVRRQAAAFATGMGKNAWALLSAILGERITKNKKINPHVAAFLKEHLGKEHTMPKFEDLKQFVKNKTKQKLKEKFEEHTRIALPDFMVEGNLSNTTHAAPAKVKTIKLHFKHTHGRKNKMAEIISAAHPARTFPLHTCLPQYKDAEREQYATGGSGNVKSWYAPTYPIDTYVKFHRGLEINVDTTPPFPNLNPTVPFGYSQGQDFTQNIPTDLVGPSSWTWGENMTLFSRADVFQILYSVFEGCFEHGGQAVTVPRCLVGKQDMLFKIDSVKMKLCVLNTNRMMPVNVKIHLVTPKKIIYCRGKAIGAGTAPESASYVYPSPCPIYDVLQPWDAVGEDKPGTNNWNTSPLLPEGQNTVDNRFIMPAIVDDVRNTSTDSSQWGLQQPICTELSTLKDVTVGLSSRFQERWEILHVYSLRLEPDQCAEILIDSKFQGLQSFKKLMFGETDDQTWDSIFQEDSPIDWRGIDQPAVWPGQSISAMISFNGDEGLVRGPLGISEPAIKTRDSEVKDTTPTSIRCWVEKSFRKHGGTKLDLSRTFQPAVDVYEQLKVEPGFVVSSRTLEAGKDIARWVPYTMTNDSWEHCGMPFKQGFQDLTTANGTVIDNSSPKYEHTDFSAKVPRQTGSVATEAAVPLTPSPSPEIEKLTEGINDLINVLKQKDGKPKNTK